MLSTKPPFALGPAGGCAPFAPNPLKGAPSSPEGTTSSPIAPQPVDEVDKASAKLAQYMESQALATTADARASTFGQIRPKLRDVAFQFAESFKIAARAVVEQSLEMGRLVLRMKTDLKRSEYRIFLSWLGWTQSKANKYAKIALRFEGFAIEQLCGISLLPSRYKIG